MASIIKHEGEVVSVNGNMARVRIMQAGSCSACQAKAMCASAEAKVKELDAVMMEPVAVGDSVVVEVSQSMGWIAVVLAYVIPFILLLAGVAILGRFRDEAAAGTLSILIVGLWYLVLKLMNSKINKHFSFTVRKLTH